MNPSPDNPAELLEPHPRALELYDSAIARRAELGSEISKEAGAEIINLITEAFSNGLLEWNDFAAHAYQLTAEIFDAWGDESHAIEYFNYALDCDPCAPVKARYEALCLSARTREMVRQREAFASARRQRLESLLSNHRDFVIEKLSLIKCRHRPGEENGEPLTLWQIFERINTGTLPKETEACIEGSDDWRDVDTLCEMALM